jgi:guanine deaminase
MDVKILKGHIIYTESLGIFVVKENAYLVYEGDRILDVLDVLPPKYLGCDIKDFGNNLIIPGFYDLHLHSGQYSQCGIGMSKQLLEWLDDYTYDVERRFEELEFADQVNRMFVNDLIGHGTLGASVFTTTSLVGTESLYKIFLESGLRAYIGKVCMEAQAPSFILKDHETNIGDVIRLVRAHGNTGLVKSIITPRFAPTSTSQSLEALGVLARQYNLPVQSHIDENSDEIEWVKDLYGESSYAKVYDIHGLYGQQTTLMAHGIHMTDEEIELTKERDVILVHCPDSNLNLRSGIMPVRKYLNKGIRVGLGTDIAGGHKISMTEAIVRAIQLSKHYSIENSSDLPLSFAEAFYMATVVGGEFFGKLGKLKSDYSMDCLIIEDAPLYKELYKPLERLEKFVYTGDDRWIKHRYVSGKEVKHI